MAGVGAVLAWKLPGVGRRALDWHAALATVLGLMTSAAVVAIAFLADRFSEHDALQPASGDLGTAITWTGGVLLVSGSGLFCALAGAVFCGSDRGQRWAGGCLAVACVVVLVLLPAPVMLIWEASAADPVTAPISPWG